MHITKNAHKITTSLEPMWRQGWRRTRLAIMIPAMLIFVLMTTVILLHAAPAAAVENRVDNPDPFHAANQGVSLSGDDAYDPAAGGQPLLARTSTISYSGDDAYDPAAGGQTLRVSTFASSFSGDDAYDPAAGGLNQPLATKYVAIQQ